MEKQVKPDWITDEQWVAVPSEFHWLSQKRGAESLAQSKTQTTEEIKAQFLRLRSVKNWK